MTHARFEDLEVWKRSARLSSEIYQSTRNLKDWGFRDQITRAGLSVPSNIAEGFERESNLEFIRFLAIAKGSCGEVRTQLYIGKDIGYLNKDCANRLISESEEISRMIAGLMKKRREFQKNVRDPSAHYSGQRLQ